MDSLRCTCGASICDKHNANAPRAHANIDCDLVPVCSQQSADRRSSMSIWGCTSPHLRVANLSRCGGQYRTIERRRLKAPERKILSCQQRRECFGLHVVGAFCGWRCGSSASTSNECFRQSFILSWTRAHQLQQPRQCLIRGQTNDYAIAAAATPPLVTFVNMEAVTAKAQKLWVSVLTLITPATLTALILIATARLTRGAIWNCFIVKTYTRRQYCNHITLSIATSPEFCAPCGAWDPPVVRPFEATAAVRRPDVLCLRHVYGVTSVCQ